MMKKIVLTASIIFLLCIQAFTQPADLRFFQRAYPQVDFKYRYDIQEKDWVITITSMGKATELYWAGGRFLPKEELSNANHYRTNLWNYPYELKDPATMTEGEVEACRNFGDEENRKTATITGAFFFDAVYDTKTQLQAEKHMVKITLLGQQSKVHELLVPVLKQIDDEVMALSKTDTEISEWLKTLTYADSYFWRTIRDTGGKSFHSFGIAVDVLPQNRNAKSLYWLWERDFYPNDWMLTPLSRRWIPPQKVLDIFEAHGFIWGGKWAVWDNMHFEYHPELFEYRKIISKE